MGRPAIDMTGKRFGRLVVLERVPDYVMAWIIGTANVTAAMRLLFVVQIFVRNVVVAVVVLVLR
jgi:hypothetical protein